MLALAIVVEARAIMAGWTPGEMRTVKSMQGLAWATPLIVYAIATPACFRSLAGERVWTGWPDIINFGITMGISTLVISPALELIVRSNARIVAGLTWLFALRFSLLRFRRMPRRIGATRHRIVAGLDELSGLERELDSLEATVYNSDHPTCAECVASLRRIDTIREKIGKRRVELNENLEELENIASEYDRVRKRGVTAFNKLEAQLERMSLSGEKSKELSDLTRSIDAIPMHASAKSDSSSESTTSSDSSRP
ncbi:hypothetical protein AB0873_20790 [Micromonospora sp. NPDC047707]|uniref:hypothetical protein n=1 Tax=Micromonospora sp. NPDC047707 TaxID=3154498 RepID=UPI0034549F7B